MGSKELRLKFYMTKLTSHSLSLRSRSFFPRIGRCSDWRTDLHVDILTLPWGVRTTRRRGRLKKHGRGGRNINLSSYASRSARRRLWVCPGLLFHCKGWTARSTLVACWLGCRCGSVVRGPTTSPWWTWWRHKERFCFCNIQITVTSDNIWSSE